MNKKGEKVKLLIVVPSLTCGGLERNVALICNNLEPNKFDATLVVLDTSNQFFQITNPGVKVIDLKVSNVRGSLLKLLKVSRRIKPDVILTTANHLNLLFALFKWLFPKRIKIIARESSIVSMNANRTRNPFLYDRLLRQFYRRIDMIVCQSAFMQQDLVANYNINIKKTGIIHNAVSVPVMHKENDSRENIANLITVTRLSNEKGLDRLIRAVSLLKIPYRFTIIGEGNMRNELQDLINGLELQDRVFLAGSHQQPFAQVQQPDLFLMGSYFEGFPNAMLEALSAGIPVVAFNAPGGIAELVNQENGILIEGDNVVEFAAGIEKALSSDFDRQAIQASVLNRFNANKIMKQWHDLLSSI